ncbi:DUF2642 domain-containing protein [Geobacillus subterraneus]|uniref:DUF2642 domain-containing protein n=1 Tax=Geobacillus subterraneus TaxID=129338 RepID=UPI00160CA750
MDFKHQARQLIGQRVTVVTVHGKFHGILLGVGDDFIVMRVNIRGRLRRILIRLALIIALLRLIGTGSGYEPHRSSDDEEWEQYLMGDD